MPFGESMNSFRWPGIRVFNTASILCYMKVNFRTFKISWNTYFLTILAKPGFMADILLILALPSFRNLWLFSMSMHSFCPNCWSHSWASQNLVRPSTPRLLMNAPNATCTTCAMHTMWFLNAGHSISVASWVDCRLSVMKWFEEALTVVIPSERPSVRSKQSSMFLKYTANLAPVC